MAKDREGKFHPRKGKPSGSLKTDSSGLKPISSGSYEESLEMVEKYTIGEEEPAPNLRVMHPNRNVDKRDDKHLERGEIKDTRAKREMLTEEMKSVAPEEISGGVTKEKFTELANFQSDCCVSIYLPTRPSGGDVHDLHDQTTFKNHLQHLSAQLRQKGMDELVIGKMLKPGYELIHDELFWMHLTKGLACFISEGRFQYLRLPIAPKEQVFTNTSFYITPLLPVLTNSDYFYLLALSKKKAKLYRADAFGMTPLRIEEMPNGVDDVVHFEEKDDQKLWRAGSSGGIGANYHGAGAGKPDEKENLAMYFDEVDETIWKAVLNKEHVPLLLAGVEYLIPIYKSVAEYKPIWDEAITGNQEHVDDNTLYEHAMHKMAPYFDERHKKALASYGNHSATELTSSIPADVISAAHYKRVWHLFVEEDAHLWGRFDEMNNELSVHEVRQEGDEDLIDKAITKTLLNGGEVHCLPKDRMPAESPVAALMRY